MITGSDERHASDRQEHALGEAAAVVFATLAGGDGHYRAAGEAEGPADQVADPWQVLPVGYQAERIARGKGRAVEVTVLFDPENVLQRAVGLDLPERIRVAGQARAADVGRHRPGQHQAAFPALGRGPAEALRRPGPATAEHDPPAQCGERSGVLPDIADQRINTLGALPRQPEAGGIGHQPSPEDDESGSNGAGHPGSIGPPCQRGG